MNQRAARDGDRRGQGEPRRSLVSQSAVTTLAAALGLLSGLVVDVVIAGTFGAGLQTDAFFVGARIPLAVAVVVLIAANQALVPAFSSWLILHGERESGRLTCAVSAIAAVSGLVVAGVVMAASGPICRVLAPGLPDEAVKLAADVLSVMALTIPALAVSEVLRAFLNARNAFVTPALINIVLNATVVAVLLTHGNPSILVLAWGYVLGNAARMLSLVGMSVRRGLALNPVPGLRRRESWSAIVLCGRPLTGAGLAPLVRTVEQAFVSFLPTGSVSLLNYGYRLVAGLGGAVLFRSVIVTLVPRLTRAIARGHSAVAAGLTGLGMRLMLIVAVPLAVFTAVLAQPAVRLLFERGRFEAADAALLGMLLTLFAVSMPPDAISRAQMAPYFSRLDTKVPFRNSLVGMAVNLALLPIALIPDSPTAALFLVVLAYVASRWVMVINAQIRLRRDGLASQASAVRTLVLILPPVMLGAASMGAVGLALDLQGMQSGPRLAGSLALTVSLGVAILIGTALLRRRTLAALLDSTAWAESGAHDHNASLKGPAR